MRLTTVALAIVVIFVNGGFATTDNRHLQCRTDIVTLPNLASTLGSFEYNLSIPLSGGGVLLRLAFEMEWSPVLTNHCSQTQTGEALQMFYPLFSQSMPFAQFPTKCRNTQALRFGVDSHVINQWGSDPRSVTQGTTFAPQLSTLDMVGIAQQTIANNNGIVRVLFRLQSGSVRRLESLAMRYCIFSNSSSVNSQSHIDGAMVLPFHECIDASQDGGCVTYFGYVASQTVNISHSSHQNAFAPLRWKNGWHLPTHFEQGYHPRAFRVSWMCSTMPGQFNEIQWRLNGTTSMAVYSRSAVCSESRVEEQTQEDTQALHDHQGHAHISFDKLYHHHSSKRSVPEPRVNHRDTRQGFTDETEVRPPGIHWHGDDDDTMSSQPAGATDELELAHHSDYSQLVIAEDIIPAMCFGQNASDTRNVTIYLRDFSISVSNFNATVPHIVDFGIVQQFLLAGLPVYNSSNTNPTILDPLQFPDWYTTSVALEFPVSIDKTGQQSPAEYSHTNNQWFPLDGLGLENEGLAHNYRFTSVQRYCSTRCGGEKHAFHSNDDIWLFINDQLVLDVGGLRDSQTRILVLDDILPGLGVSIGENYRVAIFQASRQDVVSQYNFQLGPYIPAIDDCCSWVDECGVCGGSAVTACSPSVSPSLSNTPSSSPTSTTSESSTPSTTESLSSTPTSSITASPSNTPSSTLSVSSTLTSTLSSTQTPSSTPSLSNTPSASTTSTTSESPTQSIGASHSVTPTASTTPSSTATPSVSDSETPSSSATPSLTQSVGASHSVTPTASITVSSTETPSVSYSATPSSSATSSVSYSATRTASVSASPSVSQSATPTASVSASFSQTSSLTVTGTAAVTTTSTASASHSATPSFTPVPTPTCDDDDDNSFNNTMMAFSWMSLLPLLFLLATALLCLGCHYNSREHHHHHYSHLHHNMQHTHPHFHHSAKTRHHNHSSQLAAPIVTLSFSDNISSQLQDEDQHCD